MYEQDYIMRMVAEFVRLLGMIFFGQGSVEYHLPEDGEYTELDLLHLQLVKLIEQGCINKAEDLLFEGLNTESKIYLKLVLDFYRRLNDLDDEFLEQNDFPRDEIKQGLGELADKFGIPLD